MFMLKPQNKVFPAKRSVEKRYKTEHKSRTETIKQFALNVGGFMKKQELKFTV